MFRLCLFFNANGVLSSLVAVETIGDCYGKYFDAFAWSSLPLLFDVLNWNPFSVVAVAGLPMPRKDHAQVMARFSSECLSKMDLVRSVHQSRKVGAVLLLMNPST